MIKFLLQLVKALISGWLDCDFTALRPLVYWSILFAGLFVSQSLEGQNVSISITNNNPTVPQDTEGTVTITVCNTDDVIDLVANRIRPLVSFPSGLIGATAVATSFDDFDIIFDNGQSIRFQNNAIIPAGECRNITVRYTGVNVGGPQTITATMGFNGPQTPGNEIFDDNATVQMRVLPAVLVAVDDIAGPINGFTGQLNILNVQTNDTRNGEPVIFGNYVITTVTPDPTGKLTVNGDGEVSLAPQTPAGTVSLRYRICEVAQPTNCAEANVIVTVNQAEILAVDDNFGPINGLIGQNGVGNVLTNDLLNGAPVIQGQVTLAELGNNSGGNVTLLSNGNINVASNTPAAVYEINYSICEILNPANCSEATAFVDVRSALIVANDDLIDEMNAVNGFSGQMNALFVLDNDLLNNNPVVASQVTITRLTPEIGSPLILNTTSGAVSVAPQTAAGVYTLEYRICENLNPDNCDDATVTVFVRTAPIEAIDDSNAIPVNGFSGNPTVLNVLNNDLLNGIVVDPNLVVLTLVDPTDPDLSFLNFDVSSGIVSVPAQTQAGVYEFDYQICELLNPSNCDIATVTITVAPAAIIAVDDVVNGVNGVDGAVDVVNVLTNDLLNGAVLDPDFVTITDINDNSLGVITINPLTGSVNVAPNTPTGSYTSEYTICEILNPTNCSTGTVTVNVVAAAIVANDDSNMDPINGYIGSINVLNVLDNDLLNGVPVSLSTVAITNTTTVMGPGVGVSLDPLTGIVSIAPQTMAGTYTFNYTICEVLNPANCDQAMVTITVAPAVIEAVDDLAGVVNAFAGAVNILNVLDNDRLNGELVIPAEVFISSITNPSPGVISLDQVTGNFTVLPKSPEGNYSLTYTLCEVLNPTNCDDAVVSVSLEAAPIVANNDINAIPVNGFVTNNNVYNVLENDLLNGMSILLSDVVITTITPDPLGRITLRADGSVDVLPQTPIGIYELTYRICEVVNPDNCDEAIAAVIVEAAEIVANNDLVPTANGTDGNPNLINVLTNDRLNGQVIDPTLINLTLVEGDPLNAISLNPNGSISLAPGTPDGVYTLTYRICEILNGVNNCDDAVVTVNVFIRPDLTPTIDINNLEFTVANVPRDFVVNVFEVLDADQLDGTNVSFRISKLSAFTITYSTDSEESDVFGGVMNTNSDWNFTENSSFITVTAKPGTTVQRGDAKAVGFSIRRNAGVPANTEQNITVTILNGSAGEVNFSNNIVQTRITAN